MNHKDTKSQRTRLDELSNHVMGLCIEVHRELGPGLLESAYEEALAHELSMAGLSFERQRDMPLLYKGVRLDCGYRLDLVIEGGLIVELKTVGELMPIHQAQLLTYLKLEQRSLGLLINFNVPLLKDGIRRVVAGGLYKDPTAAGGDLRALILPLCASVTLWFKSRI